MASANPRPRLLNLSNEEVIPINIDRILVGRSLKADYVIFGPAISRIHFSVEKKEGLWTIKDHSTNGTYINNVLLKSDSKTLNSGDMIHFTVEPGISLKFEMPSESSPTTNSEPNPDFVVSSTNGNDLPSVSNDHSYDRTPEENPAVVIDLTSPEGAPGPSCPTKKRKRLTSSDAPPKLTEEEPPEQPKRQCVLESSDLECSICQELFIKAATLNCSHSFCSFCINRWKSQRNHCPICRRPIESVNPTMVLDNFVKKLIAASDDERKKEWEEVLKKRDRDSESVVLRRSRRRRSSSLDSGEREALQVDEEYRDFLLSVQASLPSDWWPLSLFITRWVQDYEEVRARY